MELLICGAILILLVLTRELGHRVVGVDLARLVFGKDIISP